MPDGQEITERAKPDEIPNPSADPNDPWPEPRKSPESPYQPRSPILTGLAIVLTSLFFAALHAPQWPAPIPLFLLSLGLGIVYLRTGSLLATICMHAIFNGISMLTLFYATLSGIGREEAAGASGAGARGPGGEGRSGCPECWPGASARQNMNSTRIFLDEGASD